MTGEIENVMQPISQDLTPENDSMANIPIEEQWKHTIFPLTQGAAATWIKDNFNDAMDNSAKLRPELVTEDDVYDIRDIYNGIDFKKINADYIQKEGGLDTLRRLRWNLMRLTSFKYDKAYPLPVSKADVIQIKADIAKDSADLIYDGLKEV